MNVAKKTIIASACGLALTMGAVILLVLISMLPQVPELAKIMHPYVILTFSLLIVFPFISIRLGRLESQNKVIGWTLIGLGTQLFVIPIHLLFIILGSPPTTSGLLFGGMILTGSMIFGVPAGMLTAAAGSYLLKRSCKR